jgi:hypothetical protein
MRRAFWREDARRMTAETVAAGAALRSIGDSSAGASNGTSLSYRSSVVQFVEFGKSSSRRTGELPMSAGTILLIILILILIGALPTWPYSSGWGYYPSGGIGLVLSILLILVLMGRL